DAPVDLTSPAERTEVAEPHAIRVEARQPAREFEGESCLAHAAGAAEGHDARHAERGRDCADVVVAAHDAARGNGERASGRGKLVLQDPTLEFDQRRAGLEAMLGQLLTP